MISLASAAAAATDSELPSEEAPVPIEGADGSPGLDLRGSLQDYAIVRILPDGRLAFGCVTRDGVAASLNAPDEAFVSAGPSRWPSTASLMSRRQVPGVIASTITIINADGPGEGFNDPTPVSPVGGNPGTTIGAQRLYVFQHAANIWAGLLPSAVQIRVQAKFDPLLCSSTSGVLGSAGPIQIFRDFTNAPVAGHLYHVALANKISGIDLSTGNDDITMTFNSSVGTSSCLTVG